MWCYIQVAVPIIKKIRYFSNDGGKSLCKAFMKK